MEQYKEQSVDARTKPLTGVRVLDMTHAYSGPFCTMHLAVRGLRSSSWKCREKGISPVAGPLLKMVPAGIMPISTAISLA